MDVGKLIALEEAKRRRRSVPSSTPRRGQLGLVVQWPGTQPAAAEQRGARPVRRRRVAPLRGWLSTLVAAGILTALLGAFAAVRIMADHSAQTEASPPDSLDTSTAAVEAVSPSVAQPARETSPVQQLASRPVRFSAKPIEPSYTVQAGDSLSAIAQRSNTTADAIQAINNLPDRSVLSVGQRLVIP